MAANQLQNTKSQYPFVWSCESVEISINFMKRLLIALRSRTQKRLMAKKNHAKPSLQAKG